MSRFFYKNNKKYNKGGKFFYRETPSYFSNGGKTDPPTTSRERRNKMSELAETWQTKLNLHNYGKEEISEDILEARYGTGDESHLIIFDPNKAGGIGLGSDGFSEDDQTHDHMQKMFNTGRFGYNPKTGALVRLKDPSIYEGVLPANKEQKEMREKVDLEKREKEYNDYHRAIAMGMSKEDASLWSKMDYNERDQFAKDKAKRDMEDFIGVTDVKRLLKSNSAGEILTNLTNTRLGNLAGLLPGRIEYNPANIGRTTITANTMEEAFANAEASENIKYGDQFLWERPDGTRERMYYEHAGKPNDEITLKILKRIEDKLTPEEYGNFIKRYAGWNNPNIRIGVGNKGTQFASNVFGRDDKGTIHISADDAKSVDNLLESIYSEGAHAEQQQRRGRASYEIKSAKGHVYDFVTRDDRYERKGSFERHAHGGGPYEDLGYGGIEGKMMYEDFYSTRGKYDHDKDRFEKPIDRQYFMNEMAKKQTKKIQENILKQGLTKGATSWDSSLMEKISKSDKK